MVGYSLFGTVAPTDTDTVEMALPCVDNEDEETVVSVPFCTRREHGDDLLVERTNEGLINLLDSGGVVVEAVDPLGID